jgi:hypothetical protein
MLGSPERSSGREPRGPKVGKSGESGFKRGLEAANIRACPPEKALSQGGGVPGGKEVKRDRKGVNRCLGGKSAKRGRVEGVEIITMGVIGKLTFVFVKIEKESIDWFDDSAKERQSDNMTPDRERQIQILGGAMHGISM